MKMGSTNSYIIQVGEHYVQKEKDGRYELVGDIHRATHFNWQQSKNAGVYLKATYPRQHVRRLLNKKS